MRGREGCGWKVSRRRSLQGASGRRSGASMLELIVVQERCSRFESRARARKMKNGQQTQEGRLGLERDAGRRRGVDSGELDAIRSVEARAIETVCYADERFRKDGQGKRVVRRTQVSGGVASGVRRMLRRAVGAEA